MLGSKKIDSLLASIREGRVMSRREKFNLIIGLSIPSILAQITIVMMFFIDASMVGRLGAKASAAIGLVESATWLLGSFTNATSMGFSVQVAHFIGANDFEKARDVFRHGLICAFFLSILVLLFGWTVSSRLPYWLGGGEDIAKAASHYFLVYALAMPFFQLSNLCGAMLKCTGNMRIPSVVSIMMCILDVIFNYFFIYMLGLGVMGAALGTAFAIAVAAFTQAYFAIFRSKLLSLRLDRKPFRWVGNYVLNAFKIGGPMGVQALLMSGAQIVSTMIVAPLGNVAIAANTFAITVESLCYMPGYGIGEAATTLVGQSRGAGRRELCFSFARMTLFSGMVVMAFMGTVMFVFAPEMMSLLSPVEAICNLGTAALRIEAFAEPMFAASIVCYCIFVGAGDTLKPAIMNLCSMWFVRLSLAALLAPRYGLKGVWVAMAIELVIRGLIFLVRMFFGNWLYGMPEKKASA